MPEPLAATAQRLGALLKQRNQNVAVAESSAGGLISAALLAVPGASAYFEGGAVLYTYRSREVMLDVEPDWFEGVRPSTEEYALRMARGMLRNFPDVTWTLAETGAAGPSGNRYGDAAGHACLAVAGRIERAITVETESSDREANMRAFAQAALELLESVVNEVE